jgi:hypothetical protein
MGWRRAASKCKIWLNEDAIATLYDYLAQLQDELDAKAPARTEVSA